MQQLHNLELRVGDRVLIDWSRTRWDHRQGTIWELRHEPGQVPYALVLIDGIATRFPVQRLCRPSLHQGLG
jgi:hypothetical protein